MAISRQTCRKSLKRQGKKPGDIIVGGIDMSPATVDGIIKGLYLRELRPGTVPAGVLPRPAVPPDEELQDPGPEHRYRVNTFTPKNYQDLKPLIDQGIPDPAPRQLPVIWAGVFLVK